MSTPEPMPSAREPIVSLLRLEGSTVLLLAIAMYASLGYGWILFGILLLLPDLSMLGYLSGPRIGALTYNFAHTYPVPFSLGVVGWITETQPVLAAALIWTAHIGLDRMLGYGLKLPTFRDTHLGTIGRR